MQREYSESAASSQQPAAGCPSRAGLAFPDSLFGLGKDLFFWLGFQEGGRGKQTGRAKGRPHVAGLLR